MRVRFDVSDVERYYKMLCDSLTRPAREHHFECLNRPLEGADLYLRLAAEASFDENETNALIGNLHNAVGMVQSRITDIRGSLPPQRRLCTTYVEATYGLASLLRDDLLFAGSRPFLRDCGHYFDMANMMFSPEDQKPETFTRLRPYHCDRFPDIFGLNRSRHERPVLPVQG